MRVTNLKKYSKEESLQILSRISEVGATQADLADYLTRKGHKMGASNVGKLVRGEITGRDEVFAEIEKFLSELKNILDKAITAKIKKGLLVL